METILAGVYRKEDKASTGIRNILHPLLETCIKLTIYKALISLPKHKAPIWNITDNRNRKYLQWKILGYPINMKWNSVTWQNYLTQHRYNIWEFIVELIRSFSYKCWNSNIQNINNLSEWLGAASNFVQLEAFWWSIEELQLRQEKNN